MPRAICFIARHRTGVLPGRWQDRLISNNIRVIVVLLVLGVLPAARGLHILLTRP